MHLSWSPHVALVVAIGLTLCGCGDPSPAAAPAAPASSQAAPAEKIVLPPAGWDAANQRSAEYYQAGNFSESIAVLEAFAKAHPDFAGAELMIGDNWWTMPSTAKTPEPERLARASAHLRRGIVLAADDYDRDWGAKSLFRTCEKAVQSAALSAAAKRQMIAEARTFTDEILQKRSMDAALLQLKKQLTELDAKLAAG